MTGKKEMKVTNGAPQELSAQELDQAQGGLLPAVQKVREAAATDDSSGITKVGAGTLTLSGSSAAY